MSRSRSLLALLLAAMLVVLPESAAQAYGAENWQIAFSGTGVVPSTGQGFGFWGWCALGGGVTSGNTGDCEFSQYVHGPSGSGFTCETSLDITAWDGSGGTFVISGTGTAEPAAAATQCLALFPGGSTFGGVDSMIPSAPGHYPIGSLGPGLKGTFQIQVAQVP